MDMREKLSKVFEAVAIWLGKETRNPTLFDAIEQIESALDNASNFWLKDNEDYDQYNEGNLRVKELLSQVRDTLSTCAFAGVLDGNIVRKSYQKLANSRKELEWIIVTNETSSNRKAAIKDVRKAQDILKSFAQSQDIVMAFDAAAQLEIRAELEAFLGNGQEAKPLPPPKPEDKHHHLQPEASKLS